MFNQPFFSIVIPTYNYAQFLPDAIESVLNQSFDDFELLIQDDVSTDNTEEILSSYNDSRIYYQKNPSNLGIFGNLNQLCARAKGRYIKVLCADDVLSKWCLETITQTLRKEEFKYKLVSVKETPNRSEIVQKPLFGLLENFTVNRDKLFSYLAESNNWGAGLAELCVERDFFQSQGFFGEFDKEKDFSKDILIWLEMVLKTDALMITCPLVFQRSHPDQARYKLSRITQLQEMLTFFYGREKELELYTCPNFVSGRNLYLANYVLSHYWYAVKAMTTGHGLTYFQRVRCLLRKFGYQGFPWFLAAFKVKQHLFSRYQSI